VPSRQGRPDVTLLITVAGNLDHDDRTSYHNVPPLTASENPANQIASLWNIPQQHYVGGTDRVIRPELARRFAGRFPPDRRPQVIVEGDFDHQRCWAENWQRIYSEIALPKWIPGRHQDRDRQLETITGSLRFTKPPLRSRMSSGRMADQV
jgi:hypothetical protein